MPKIIHNVYNHSDFDWKLYILSAYIRRNFFRTCKQHLPQDYPKNGYTGLVLENNSSIIVIPMAKSTSASEAIRIAKNYQAVLSREINESLYFEYHAKLERKFELVIEEAPYFLEWFDKLQKRYPSKPINPETTLRQMRDYSSKRFHDFVRADFCTAEAEYIVD